jgi:hypothetical protein
VLTAKHIGFLLELYVNFSIMEGIHHKIAFWMTLLIPLFLIILFLSGSPYVIFYTMLVVGIVLVLFVLAMIMVPDKALQEKEASSSPPTEDQRSATKAEDNQHG